MHALDPAQSSAVLDPSPRKLILAGAGSGKTRVLVEAVGDAFKRCRPSEIIVITYTTKAAKELKERIAARFDSESVPGYIGTIHSLLFKLLRAHGHLLGLPESLSVIDEEAATALVESVAAEMGVKTPIKALMEVVKKNGVAVFVMGAPSKEDLCAIEFNNRLRSAGMMTYDQILLHGSNLLRKVPEQFCSALFVDECQDCTELDWTIFEAMKPDRIFAAGDPRQRIFGFRSKSEGAFEKVVANPNWKVIELEKNYRSATSIIGAASSLIQHNHNPVEKGMVPTRNEIGTIVVRECQTPIEEVTMVAATIASTSRDEFNGYEHFAILTRTNRRANEFSTFLKSMGIPVQERKHEPDPKDWRECVLLLTVASQPWNDFAAHGFIALREGRKIADKLRREAETQMQPLAEKYFGQEGLTVLATEQATKEDWKRAFGLMLRYHKISEESLARLWAAFDQVDEPFRLPNLLLALAAKEESEEEGHGVTVSTVHSAKGREWPVVFIVGCEEGEFPNLRKDCSEAEERRLFYVGVTRAKDVLYLTHCAARPQNRGPNAPPGPMEPRERSRFLSEMGL